MLSCSCQAAVLTSVVLGVICATALVFGTQQQGRWCVAFACDHCSWHYVRGMLHLQLCIAGRAVLGAGHHDWLGGFGQPTTAGSFCQSGHAPCSRGLYNCHDESSLCPELSVAHGCCGTGTGLGRVGQFPAGEFRGHDADVQVLLLQLRLQPVSPVVPSCGCSGPV